ncbi:MAG: hypothetical protein KatS3mg009_0529 [Acidimicrobiia bacterium]|nr:MAG: hypothetical protein KatS3mg009_0529 [Acidimicrobiia bacterium]
MTRSAAAPTPTDPAPFGTGPGPVATLLTRARHLRAAAHGVHPVVARAYRRRAAELTLAAWAGAVREAPVPVDDVIAESRRFPHLDAA